MWTHVWVGLVIAGRIHPTRLCCQGEFHPCSSPILSSVLVLSSVTMYLLRIMIPHCYHHHHHPPRVCAPRRSFLMEWCCFFPAADMYGHARVFGASFSFLNAHLEVLFVLVAMLSSLCRHDSLGALRHLVLLDLWACYLTDALGCLHA
jgi:hypothetical protein